MELIPIQPNIEDNPKFINQPDCQENLEMTIGYYKIIGFNPPWICYFAKKGNQLVGFAAFKGQPVNGIVEIAYGTFEHLRKQGIGTEMCKTLIELSLKTDSKVRITARTLPKINYSAKILEKNGFELIGMVEDKDDGEVWE